MITVKKPIAIPDDTQEDIFNQWIRNSEAREQKERFTLGVEFYAALKDVVNTYIKRCKSIEDLVAFSKILQKMDLEVRTVKV